MEANSGFHDNLQHNHLPQARVQVVPRNAEDAVQDAGYAPNSLHPQQPQVQTTGNTIPFPGVIRS